MYKESPYFTPKVEKKKNKKRAKAEENRRRYQRDKARKERERVRRAEQESMIGVPFDQREDLAYKLPWAKEKVYEFMTRTNRSLDFDQIHRINKSAGRRTVDYLPGNNSLSLTFNTPGRKRKGLNRDRAQQVARKLGVPYWREMQAEELRAVLLILIHKDGIDMFGQPIE